MAYNIDWNGIVAGTDTGDAVENKLTASFNSIETALNDLLDKHTTYLSMSGQVSPTYSLTTTLTPINNFSNTSVGTNFTINAAAGTFMPTKNGAYRISFYNAMTFTSENYIRTITLAMYNVTDNLTVASTHINVPREATKDGEAVSAIIDLEADKAYAVYISASEVMSITLEQANISVNLVG